MKSDVELIAKAEAILDRTLAYQAAQAVHELKSTLGIEIQQINLEVSPMPNDAASYRAACTIVRLTTKGPLEILLTVQVPGDSAAGNDGQFN